MPESHNVEHKGAWRDECLKRTRGFADADGGAICIGMSDDGEAHCRSGATRQQLKGATPTRFLSDRTGFSREGAGIPGVGPDDLWQGSFSIFRDEAPAGHRMGEGASPAPRPGSRTGSSSSAGATSRARASCSSAATPSGASRPATPASAALSAMRTSPTAQAFYRAGHIESWGRGIDKTRQACEANGNPTAEFGIDSTGMVVTLRAPEGWGQRKPEEPATGRR